MPERMALDDRIHAATVVQKVQRGKSSRRLRGTHWHSANLSAPQELPRASNASGDGMSAGAAQHEVDAAAAAAAVGFWESLFGGSGVPARAADAAAAASELPVELPVAPPGAKVETPADRAENATPMRSSLSEGRPAAMSLARASTFGTLEKRRAEEMAKAEAERQSREAHLAVNEAKARVAREERLARQRSQAELAAARLAAEAERRAAERAAEAERVLAEKAALEKAQEQAEAEARAAAKDAARRASSMFHSLEKEETPVNEFSTPGGSRQGTPAGDRPPPLGDLRV